MKKIITTLTIFLATFGLIYTQESSDVDIDVDVDVLVEQPVQPSYPQITVEEIVKTIEKRLEKAGFTNEQKEKILAKIKEKIEQGEIPPVQLAVKICEKAELGVWNNRDIKKCEKDIENTVKMIKKQIAKAKSELEKEENKYRKKYKEISVSEKPNKPTRPEIQPKAVDVLESLVEKGIPVEHALNVVKEAMKGKEGDIDVIAREKIIEEISKREIVLPAEFKEKIQEQLQTHIQTQTQLQNQMLEQKIQLQTYQETQTQLQQQMQELYEQQYQQSGSGSTWQETDTQLQQQMQERYEQQYQQSGGGGTGASQSGSGWNTSK